LKNIRKKEKIQISSNLCYQQQRKDVHVKVKADSQQ
jgi:hypothetical protein